MNCLVIEPTLKTVSGVIGWPAAMFASPRPPDQTTRPPRITMAAPPGPSDG
jgi:hypothetical protein